MLLGPQGVGQTVDAVQLTQQRLQLGAVPQCHHGTDVAPVDPDGHPVDHEQVRVGEHELVLTFDVAAEQLAQPPFGEELVQRLADCRAAESEQSAGLVVGHADPSLPVEGDHALADAVQHRLALLQEGPQVVQFEPEGHPLEPPGQHQRGEDADQKSRRCVEQQDRDLVPQLARHFLLEEANGYLADDGAVGRS